MHSFLNSFQSSIYLLKKEAAKSLKANLYPNYLKNWDLDLAKAPPFDLPKSTPYYNMELISEVESRELSLKPKTNFSSSLGIKKSLFLSALLLASFYANLNASELLGITIGPLEISLNLDDNYEAKYGDELTSRFIEKSDPTIYSLADIPIRSSWWSRPYEYAWALQFVDQKTSVLDAACGISHPFKWELGKRAKHVVALDSDSRIINLEAIIQETYRDLGEIAYALLTNSLYLYNSVETVCASIFALPDTLPKFDRIFCISVLEHLHPNERELTLQNFANHLSENGLLILTVDYPEITPETLIKIADQAGLIPAGKTNLELPNNRLTNGFLSIYRAVFIHKPKT